MRSAELKALVGLLLIIFGVVFGLWAGVWWAFAGGLIDIFNAIKYEHVEASVGAWGCVKVAFAGVIGWGSALLCIIPGVALTK